MYTQSQNSVFLRYLALEMIKQTKESSLISFESRAKTSLYSYPYSFGSVLFGSVRLYGNQTERFQMIPFLQRSQEYR